MIIVTEEQFFNFVKSQPDDRNICFDEYWHDVSCGCPMIHYAREVLNRNDLNASDHAWYVETNDETVDAHVAQFENDFCLNSFSIFNHIDYTYNCTNYGMLKSLLSEKYPDFNWN